MIAALPALALAALLGAEPQLPVQTHTLDNGLTVLLHQDKRLPVVAVEVRYFVGSQHERKGRTGFAHLFEHLMFQGSKNFDDEFFKPFEPIGAAINGTTNTDRTNYYERVPSNYLETVLWMESDRMEGLLPALTKAKLDNQRDVVRNERRQNYEDRPYGMVWGALAENLYPVGHPYHHLTIGSHADLTAATLDDVKAFFRQYYVPANAVITIVGDIDPDATLAMVERYFGKLPAGERATRPTIATAATLPNDKKVVLHDSKIKLPRVYLAWHSPGLYAPGDAELDILSGVLTDGKASRLFKPLVFDQKVCKDVAAYQVSRQRAGFYVIQATAAPGKTTDDVAAALDKALDAALASPPTDDEVARMVNGWRKGFFAELEGALERAQLISNYFHFTGDPSYLGKDLARYTTVTPDMVAGAAKRYITTQPRLRIDVIPAKAEGGEGK